MPWTELTDLRTKSARSYVDDADPRRRACSATIAPLHYESVLDSGVYDLELDLSPVVVNNPELDGWRVTHAGWHYALGIPGDKVTDGWVGFGGRKGAHWFKFRLARAGYLHHPTRVWEDIGGSPTYDRGNLSQELGTIELSPETVPITAASTIQWSNIWTTPGGGALDLQWRIDGQRLKEDVIINQTAREWIQSNRPPSTPVAETYFGFVFQVDWSDIPKAYLADALQDIDGDFDDDLDQVTLRDAQDRLLAFLPWSKVTVPAASDNPPASLPLRKRFWKDPDGNHYLLLGVRCDQLASLPAGPLHFDPTVDETVGSGPDDACERDDTWAEADYTTNPCGAAWGNDWHSAVRFSSVTISGGTIDVAYVKHRCPNSNSTAVNYDHYGEDAASPSQFADGNGNLSNRTRTTATVNESPASWTNGTSYDTPSLVTIVQELVDTYDYSGGAPMVLFRWFNNGLGCREEGAYDANAAYGAQLHIEYTDVTGAIAMNHYRRRRSS